MWWPTICVGHCDTQSAWQNHQALQFPMGCYCTAEVVGAEAIMTTILKPMGRHPYGMFHFCAAGTPLHRPVLTEGRILGPMSVLG
jgi:hypothetical protein